MSDSLLLSFPLCPLAFLLTADSFIRSRLAWVSLCVWLRKQTEQRMADREAEAAAQAHAKKRRRQTAPESDPSRPCGVDKPTEDEECEYRIYGTGTKVPKNHLPGILHAAPQLE